MRAKCVVKRGKRTFGAYSGTVGGVAQRLPGRILGFARLEPTGLVIKKGVGARKLLGV